MTKKKRKICFVITSEIHYSRGKLILAELKKRKDVELKIVVGGSSLLRNYGDTIGFMEKDGFKPDAHILMTVEGSNPVAMAKTTGLGIIDFTTIFENMKPDVVVVRGDRYEILSPVIAAVNLNISVAHIEGGDVSGTIDESIRHAVTKLSHIHFPTNIGSKKRLIRMGEDPKYVFDMGAPEVEYIQQNDFSITNEELNIIGVGHSMDLKKPYIIVMNHPVTTEYGQNRSHTIEILDTIRELGVQTMWFWPNPDAGGDEISKAIREYREKYDLKNVRFLLYVAPEHFYALLKKAACLVGNSSTGIKECSYLGIPTVNIGTRQSGRTRGDNVIDVPYKKKHIRKVIDKQIAHGKYKKSNLYYKKNTSKRIADKLATIDLYTQKRFVD